jgi:hypothetical protein
MQYSETLDAINHPMPTWTDTVTLPCGLDMSGGVESRGSQRVAVRYDAQIRLPLTTTYDLRDRIRVTKRFGKTLATPLVYEIAAPQEQGPSGLVFNLKKLDPSNE